MPLEDIAMLSVALAPFVFLFVWLLGPRSKPRIILLVISLVLFVVFLQYTTLYLAYIAASLFPGLATSGLGTTAPLIFLAGVLVTAFSIAALLYSWYKRKFGQI
ncbi:MAG TPA: hypothetical protein VI873_04480 [Candidatus Peribacteraceae bacterium]|nr:hypothetical protein [Candidatus Peribacteraceae bacterium]